MRRSGEYLQQLPPPRFTQAQPLPVKSHGIGPAVVKGFQQRESIAVERPARAVDVQPALGIASHGKSFVKHPQLGVAVAVYFVPVGIDVGVEPFDRQQHGGRTLAEIARVAVPLGIGGSTFKVKMKEQAVPPLNDAAALLEIAAPTVAFAVKRLTIGLQMKRPRRIDHRRAVLVVAESPQIPLRVAGPALRIDVEPAALVLDGSQTRRMKG